MQFVNLKTLESLTLDTPDGPVVISLRDILRTGPDGKVRIGIEADKSIPVHRQEVFDIIKRDREKAALRKIDNRPT